MLKARIITAVLLFAGFILLVFQASDLMWQCITLIVTLIAVWEWSNLIHLKKWQMLINVFAALNIGLFFIFSEQTQLLPYSNQIRFIWLACAGFFWLIGSPIMLLTRKLLPGKFSMAVLGQLLLIATWIALYSLKIMGTLALLSVLAIVWLADISAYFVGKKFGRHKLAPQISPGKTWEGVAGAVFVVTIFGLFICYFKHYSLWLIPVLWLFVTLSVMGDLFESLLKRQAGKKDSSHLLPGHGGVLDRIDGLIATLPIAVFYIYFPIFANLQLHG